MRRELFSIGDFTVYGYGFMIGLGFILAYITAAVRGKKRGLNTDNIFYIALIALFGGFLGAKLLYIITIFKDVLKHPQLLLDFSDGYVVYGGIIVGIALGYLFCRFRKISFIDHLDIVMPSVALAQAFGRIGCLLAGCCYGVKASSDFCVVFTDSLIAPNNVPLVPTQIISCVLNLANFYILCLIARFCHKRGVVSVCYLAFYSIGRFILEFFRGDLIRGQIGPLSTSQFISIFIFAASIAMLVFLIKRAKKEEAAFAAELLREESSDCEQSDKIKTE